MRINQSTQSTHFTYSLSILVYLGLFSGILYARPKITLVTGLTIFGIGFFRLIASLIMLYSKLGICPGLYHSTLCIPKFKDDKIVFRSSKVLELGILLACVESANFFLITQAKSSYFFLGINILSFLSILIGKHLYFVSDFLGISMVAVGNILFLEYRATDDYIIQLFLIILSARIIFINRFKQKFAEIQSICIVSLIFQGLGLSVLGFFYSGIGSWLDVLIGAIYSLSSFVLLESCVNEKSGIILSATSLQIYSFFGSLSLIPCLISGLGLFFLIAGHHIFRVFPIRMNSIIYESSHSLNEGLL